MAQNVHRELVKARIRLRGVTLAELALRYGLNPPSLSDSLRRPSATYNRMVADFLGETVHTLWPLWYDVDGERLPDDPDIARRRAALKVSC